MKNIFARLSIKTIFNLAFLVATGGFLVSCAINGDIHSSALKVEEGINIEGNPLDIIQKILELSTEELDVEDNLDRTKETEPISFRDLIGYLPQSPKGWTAERPQGQTTSFGDYSVSQVKQKYFQANKTMTVSIFDWAFNSALYMPFLLSTEFSQESTEGYNKGIKIDDIPGRENYDYYTKKGSLRLLVNRRFFVQINGDNIEESELREWWEAIDSNSLSEEI